MAKQEKILLVDDEHLLATSTAQILETAGYRTQVLYDAASAAAHIQNSNFDLVILDVNMPGMSGLELLDAVEPSTLDTSFIVLTGDHSIDTAIEALRSGANDYIRKPVNPSELLIRVDRVLAQRLIHRAHQDITEKNRNLESQLQQSHKMEAIGSLAGGIAHDFNNILSIILGNSELALGLIDKNETAADNLRLVISASKRARDLVNQLLLFSRKSEAGAQSVELGSVMNDCLKLIRASIPSNIRIENNIPDSPQFIEGDATQIHQVIINLCTNAAHAMEDSGGVLYISYSTPEASFDSGFVEIRVADTGKGIDPAIQNQIFNPYFTTKTPSRGTGMGLAVVHGIVQNHGGKIEFSSTAGVGSEFKVTLPVGQANSSQSDQNKVDHFTRGGEHILVVDDETMVADVLHKMLSALGYRVTSENDSVTALQRYRSNPEAYDLVITDMTMPDLSGEILAQKLKESTPDLPILMCSGVIDDDTRLLNGAGINRFLRKPVSMLELAHAVRELLETVKKERRQAPRYVTQTEAFVVLESEPGMRCRVVDVSLSGLAMNYPFEHGDPDTKDRLSIVSANDELIVEDVPYSTVSQLKLAANDAPPIIRCGINFSGLTDAQSQQLNQFLTSATVQT